MASLDQQRMFQQLVQARRGMRERDLVESKHLLWELVTSEPTVLHCFEVIEAYCLSQGVYCKIDDQPCTAEFQRFLDRHYMSFCRAAIRAFFTYGFVPWRVKKLDGGDQVPDVLPHGTFHWFTEMNPTKKKEREYGVGTSEEGKPTQRNPGLVVYGLKMSVPLDIKEEEVFIFNFMPPALDVSVNSAFYATVPSPLAHILTDYKNLRAAQIRRSHADAWNTTAKLICSFKPNTKVQEDPTAALLDFADESFYLPTMNLSLPGMAPLLATNLWGRDVQIRKQFEGVSQTHQPDVFTLPRDHDVAQQPMLSPCEDLDFLVNKFQRDVCSSMGIPEDMIHPQSRGHETVRKTLASGRIFTASMANLCDHLKGLLTDIYHEIYGKKSEVEFVLLPMPRLEIETIADLKVLYEIGAISPDMGLQLSSLIMGTEIQSKRTHDQMAMLREKGKGRASVDGGDDDGPKAGKMGKQNIATGKEDIERIKASKQPLDKGKGASGRTGGNAPPPRK